MQVVALAAVVVALAAVVVARGCPELRALAEGLRVEPRVKGVKVEGQGDVDFVQVFDGGALPLFCSTQSSCGCFFFSLFFVCLFFRFLTRTHSKKK